MRPYSRRGQYQAADIRSAIAFPIELCHFDMLSEAQARTLTKEDGPVSVDLLSEDVVNIEHMGPNHA